ncbi:MAG: hypothetical protein QXK89_10165 [Candidatus Bathyarchaeia archaeon]
MGREIPKAVKDQAFRLWLKGESYRRICAETGMSLGALSTYINELKKVSPDLDQLRELSAILKKNNLSIFDAVRGSKLLEKLNQLGVSLEDLDNYVGLVQRISHEKGVGAEGFVESAMKLMDLERRAGKTYEELVKDLEEKRRQVEELEVKAKGVQVEIQGLVERKAQLEGEISEAERKLSQISQELNRAVSTQERLQKLGMERVASLVEFIEDCEALGFNAKEIQNLARWRKSLAEMGISPDKLRDFIEQRGSLERQLANLSREKSAREREVKQLMEEYMRLWGEVNALRGEISRLSRLSSTLKSGKLTLPCKLCRMWGVSIDLSSAESGIMSGLWCSGTCIFCRQWSTYPAWELAWFIAQLVLPAIRPRGNAGRLLSQIPKQRKDTMASLSQ